jgi:Uma2 family endonuclease
MATGKKTAHCKQMDSRSRIRLWDNVRLSWIETADSANLLHHTRLTHLFTAAALTMVVVEFSSFDLALNRPRSRPNSHTMSTYRKPVRISEQDYLQGELEGEARHEYLAGEVHAMVGASDRHNLIALNLATALRPHIRGTPCQLFMSNMKLRLEIAGDIIYYYPDLMLTCDPQDRATYFRTRPCLIVEVLSEATTRIDRREKLFAYIGIASVEAYLLLAQDRALAELHRRQDGWQTRYITEGNIPIDCLNLTVPLSLVYEEVPLPLGHNPEPA